jgi:hypothetical protein
VGGSFTDICDVQQAGCSGSFATGSFYSADFDNIYCGRSVKNCACSREYYYCMRSEGCFTSESDLLEFSDVCVSEGCTAAQCGLPQVFCNSSNTCSADFLACNNPFASVSSFGSPYQCSCIKDFTKCLSAAGCLSQLDSPSSSLSVISKVSISQIQNWCASLNFIPSSISVFLILLQVRRAELHSTRLWSQPTCLQCINTGGTSGFCTYKTYAAWNLISDGAGLRHGILSLSWIRSNCVATSTDSANVHNRGIWLIACC